MAHMKSTTSNGSFPSFSRGLLPRTSWVWIFQQKVTYLDLNLAILSYGYFMQLHIHCKASN